MAKNLLYISPQFPWNFINFSRCLKQQGVDVFGVASDHYDQLPQVLKDSLRDYYRVDDMSDYQQVLQAGLYFKNKYGAIDRVESHVEHWMPFEAALREDLGAWGKKRQEITEQRKKSYMKSVFKRLGLNVARGELFQNFEQACRFAELVHYPFILKPDSGVGASATWRVDSQEELAQKCQEHDLSGYFMEEFLDAQIYTFDGLTDHDGNIVFCTSLTHERGIMELVLNDEHVYFLVPRSLPADVEEAGRKIVKAFDMREKFFHVEFFRRRSDQKLFALEINLRPPGGIIIDMWNYADDIDMYDQWARIIAGKKFNAKWERRHCVLYISRKDNISYEYTHEDILRTFGDRLTHHERISPIYRSAMGDDAYLFRAKEFSELEPVLEYIHELKHG